MNRVRRNQSGFTLIELLLVIIVLGIVAAIVVFAVGSTRADATKSACATRVRSIKESAESVRVKTDTYPAGPVDDTTPSNPLVVPHPGALLREWPTSSDFVLQYVGTGPTSYRVDVYKTDGITLVAGGCSGL
jgi:prepilin-type N-terminal cleavage/methylation domain-containing protein